MGHSIKKLRWNLPKNHADVCQITVRLRLGMGRASPAETGVTFNMFCARRTHLEQKRDQAGAMFDAARKRLRERISICPKGEFLELSDSVDRAGEMLDHAQGALDAHIHHHCCLSRGEGSASE